MNKLHRRSFLSAAGLAAGAATIGWKPSPVRSVFAADAPDEILSPVEVNGAEAQPIMGRLPGAKRMYVLPSGSGEFHLVGGFSMTRGARPTDTGNVYELTFFTGKTGAAMPRHMHRGSHVALLVLGGEVELELNGQRHVMMHGDFANIPPGTPHAWTMRSDRAKIAIYSMNDRVGNAFAAMGRPHTTADAPTEVRAIAPAALALAAENGDFQLTPGEATGQPVRATNLMLPFTPGSYVIADGGGERFGGNVFLAKNANTTGQFLFLMTEGGPGGGVPPHFHARHFENFLGVDGETLGWAYGKTAHIKEGDYFQAPPRNLHSFRLAAAYTRFAAFLSPGIFESFFTGGRAGENGGGKNAKSGGGFGPGGTSPGAPPAGGPPTGRGGAGAGPGAAKGPGGPGGFGGNDMFRTLMMSGTGPDGYPLDVHGPTFPLPPQDPEWAALEQGNEMQQRARLLAHGMALCGANGLSREITPELRKALKFKPRPEEFV